MYKPTHTISVTHTLGEPRAAKSINSRARLAEYVSRGFILLTPEDLGVDASIHPRIHQQTTNVLKALQRQRAKRQDTASNGTLSVAPTEQVGRGLHPDAPQVRPYGVKTDTLAGAALDAQRMVTSEPVVCVTSMWQVQRLTGA